MRSSRANVASPNSSVRRRGAGWGALLPRSDGTDPRSAAWTGSRLHVPLVVRGPGLDRGPRLRRPAALRRASEDACPCPGSGTSRAATAGAGRRGRGREGHPRTGSSPPRSRSPGDGRGGTRRKGDRGPCRRHRATDIATNVPREEGSSSMTDRTRRRLSRAVAALVVPAVVVVVTAAPASASVVGTSNAQDLADAMSTPGFVTGVLERAGRLHGQRGRERATCRVPDGRADVRGDDDRGVDGRGPAEHVD